MNHTTIPGEDSKDKCECKEQSSIPFLDILWYIKKEGLKLICIENQLIETNTFYPEAAMQNKQQNPYHTLWD